MTWTLPQLHPGQPFPDPASALPARAPWPGLLAVGGRLDADSLQAAYGAGIFPWSGPDEPLLWWSPDPRMVLRPADLRVRRSLRQSARRMMADPALRLAVDLDFRAVMRGCAAPGGKRTETWIQPDFIAAYCALHARGLAHSFELRRDGAAVAGLYLVAIGGMLFGESMFTREADASKVLLMALCGFALRHGLGPIDCQQQTAHLASMGATPWPRSGFLDALGTASRHAGPTTWTYDWSQFRDDCGAWL